MMRHNYYTEQDSVLKHLRNDETEYLHNDETNNLGNNDEFGLWDDKLIYLHDLDIILKL